MFSLCFIFVRRCFFYYKLFIYSVYYMENYGSLEFVIIVDWLEMIKVEKYIEFKLYLLFGNMFIMYELLINDNFWLI